MESQRSCVFPIPILEEIIIRCEWKTKIMFAQTCKLGYLILKKIQPIFVGKLVDMPIECSNFGVLDPTCNILYMSDNCNDVIYKIELESNKITCFSGCGLSGYRDGSAVSACFSRPAGLALDKGRRILYVSDARNCAIRKISLIDGSVSTLYRNPPTFCEMLFAKKSILSVPIGIVYDSITDCVYVADFSGDVIQRISAVDGKMDILCGGTRGYKNGNYTNAQFYGPYDLAINSLTHKMYVSDVFNECIRVISLDTGEVTTFWGKSHSVKQNIKALAIDSSSNCLYFSEGSKIVKTSLSHPFKSQTIYETFDPFEGLILDPNSYSIYATNQARNRLIHIKDRTRIISHEIEVGDIPSQNHKKQKKMI